MITIYCMSKLLFMAIRQSDFKKQYFVYNQDYIKKPIRFYNLIGFSISKLLSELFRYRANARNFNSFSVYSFVLYFTIIKVNFFQKLTIAKVETLYFLFFSLSNRLYRR